MTDDGRTAVRRSADLRSGVHSDTVPAKHAKHTKGNSEGDRIGDWRFGRGNSQAHGVGDGRAVPAWWVRLCRFGGHGAGKERRKEKCPRNNDGRDGALTRPMTLAANTTSDASATTVRASSRRSPTTRGSSSAAKTLPIPLRPPAFSPSCWPRNTEPAGLTPLSISAPKSRATTCPESQGNFDPRVPVILTPNGWIRSVSISILPQLLTLP
jgi:hypothetical protein